MILARKSYHFKYGLCKLGLVLVVMALGAQLVLARNWYWARKLVDDWAFKWQAARLINVAVLPHGVLQLVASQKHCN